MRIVYQLLVEYSTISCGKPEQERKYDAILLTLANKIIENFLHAN